MKAIFEPPLRVSEFGSISIFLLNGKQSRFYLSFYDNFNFLSANCISVLNDFKTEKNNYEFVYDECGLK